MGKRGQMKMSFGMIFSIILIVIFIIFAFTIIIKFLNTGDTALIKKFTNDLQNDIDDVWKSSKAVSSETYSNIPKKIEKICFANFYLDKSGQDSDIYNNLKLTFYENENMFFYPTDAIEDLQAQKLEHLNIEVTTQENNPLCFEVVDQKVKFTLQKDYKENLVKIIE